MGLVLLAVLALLVFWIVGAYNGLIALKNQVANAWKQIDVQLKRRHDLIPNLVNAVKGAMDFEKGTLEGRDLGPQQGRLGAGRGRDRQGRG
jgi:LemA protein